MRLGRPVRSHNRRINKRLPHEYKKTIMRVADGDKEFGGEVDFDNDDSVRLEVNKSKHNDQITLNPSEDAELIWHSHPYDTPSEEPLQATPSPEDILMMIKMEDDDLWAVSTDKTFCMYRETGKTPKYSHKLRQQLNKDYDKIEKQSYKKFPQIKNVKKRDAAQTRWMGKAWLRLLRDDYSIKTKQYKGKDKVNLSLKEIKG